MFCSWLFVAILATVAQSQPSGVTAQRSNPQDLLLKWLRGANLQKNQPLRDTEIEIYLQRGEAVYLDGGFESVISVFGSIVIESSFTQSKQDPVHDNIRYNLAGALAKKGSYGWARQILMELVNRTPRSAFRSPALRKLTDLTLKSGQYEALTEFITKLPKDLSPEERDELIYLEGKMLADRGQSEQAQKALTRVSRASRFYGAAQYLQGVIALEQGQTELALHHFCSVVDRKRNGNWSSTDRVRTAFFISDKTPEITDHAWLALGRIRHDKGWYGLSVSAYRNIEPTSPLYTQACYESAWSLVRLGRNALARIILEKLLAYHAFMPDWPNARMLLGRTFIADCLFDQAMKEFSWLENFFETGRLSSEAHSANPSTPEERQALAFDRRTMHSLRQSMQMRAFITNHLHRSDPYHDMDKAARLIDKLENNVIGAERLKDMLIVLESKWNRDYPDRKEAWRQLHARVEHISARVKKAMSTLQKGLAASAVLESELRSKRDPLIRYVSSEEQNIKKLVHKLVLQREGTQYLVELAGRIREERTMEKVAGWIRAARIGKIDTVLGKKQAKETEVLNLAYGRYPLSILKELAKSGMLDETMEYWPYDGEDWPDESK